MIESGSAFLFVSLRFRLSAVCITRRNWYYSSVNQRLRRMLHPVVDDLFISVALSRCAGLLYPDYYLGRVEDVHVGSGISALDARVP